jgi:hypothetical protein
MTKTGGKRGRTSSEKVLAEERKAIKKQGLPARP